MKSIDFEKMVASGNDFIVIDNREKVVGSSGLRGLSRRMCDRNYGVGADGILLVENSGKADFRMRIINADGSEAEMCGNGARCIALYARERGIAGKKMSFETLAGVIEAGISSGLIKLKMSVPRDLRTGLLLKLSDGELSLDFVNTGVPHAVIFVDNVEEQDINKLGREVRYHSAFAPAGTNVDFVELARGGILKVRTYERGVEGETLACGTGVTASAIIASAVKGSVSPVTCVTRSGDDLKVYFKQAGNDYRDVYLEGGAKSVFSGRYQTNNRR
jgi:diaminopimelate epimerase